MHYPHTPGLSPSSFPPATAGTTYYPAIHRGTFPNTRAALASIGCVGEVAALHLANAKAEGSHSVAVPVTALAAPKDAGQCVALIQRKPGGWADLFLGLIGLADADRAEAEAVAAEIRKAHPARAVMACEWARQRRAVQ